jgi:hypothetical protein
VVGNLKLKYCPKKFNLLWMPFVMDINKDGILDIVSETMNLNLKVGY